MTDDTARRDARRNALDKAWSAVTTAHNAHASTPWFPLPEKCETEPCRSLVMLYHDLRALDAPAVEPRLQRSHNHKIDSHHWQDCPGCDDILAIPAFRDAAALPIVNRDSLADEDWWSLQLRHPDAWGLTGNQSKLVLDFVAGMAAPLVAGIMRRIMTEQEAPR